VRGHRSDLRDLDRLKEAAPSRIVNAASRAHIRSGIDFDDLERKKSYNGLTAYSQSKLCNILFTYELARRLEGTAVTANCLHPGVIASGFGKNQPGFFNFAVKLVAPARGWCDRGGRSSGAFRCTESICRAAALFLPPGRFKKGCSAKGGYGYCLTRGNRSAFRKHE
jgi:NAD(P)-dependent dehydrogenase (short-subunit alcohol dehydrogenase family)